MNYNFPSEFVSPQVKATPEYGIAYFQAAWEYWGGWGRYDDRRLLIRELRRWAMGLQSIDNMKPYFGMERADDTYSTIDWSAPAILASYRDKLVQRIANIPFQPNARAIDPKSVDKRMDKELEIKAKMKLKNENAYFKEQFGIGIYEDEKLPDDEQGVNLFMDIEYKLPVEISMTAALDWFLFLSGDRELKMQLIKDQVDIGRSFLKVDYDDQDRPIFKYVDPDRFITSYSVKADYSDITFGMELEYMTVMDIKKEWPDVDDKELEEIGKANMVRNNGSLYDFQYFPETPFTYPLFYNYKVAVLKGKFLSLDTQGYETYETPWGRAAIYEDGVKNPNLDKPEKRKQDKKKGRFDLKAQNLYTGCWIVDTKYIYNYGKAKDILRWKDDGKLNLSTKLPYIGYQPDQRDMQNKGMVERMRPSAEQMHLCLLKMQTELANAAPNGMEVDVANLTGVFLGKGKGTSGDVPASPMELYKFYRQTGTLWTNKSKNGLPQNTGATLVPVTQALWNNIQGYIAVFQEHKSVLEMMVGGSSIVNTGTPSPDSLVGIQKMAAVAADNALGNPIHGYIMTLENGLKLLSMYVQNRIERGDITVYAKGLGNDFVRAIKITKQEALADYAINIKYMPTQEEKIVFQGYIMRALDKGIISLSDAYLLETQMTNPMMAWAYLNKAEKDAEKQQQAKAMELAKTNAQAQAEAGTAVEKAKQESYMLQAQGKMAEIAAQGDVDEDKLDREYMLKGRLSRQEAIQDIELAKVVNNQRTFQNDDLMK